MTPRETPDEIRQAQSESKRSAKKDAYDRSTILAFGVLFVLPAVIILFAVLFFLPYMVRTIQEEPSGATTLRSNSAPR